MALRRFCFAGADTRKKISVLSGGERARLCLAGLMLSQHNVLILDEPGNHLDVESVDSLAEALAGLQGDRHLHQPRPLFSQAGSDFRSSRSAMDRLSTTLGTTMDTCTPLPRRSKMVNARRPPR